MNKIHVLQQISSRIPNDQSQLHSDKLQVLQESGT